MRITLQMVHDSNVPGQVNLCSGDSKITEWANEFQEYALQLCRFWGSVQRANFCLHDSCISLPREVATIEAMASCCEAFHIQNMTYQLLGPVVTGCCCCHDATFTCGHLKYEERGQSSSYAVTKKAGSKIRVYARHPNDYGKKIILQGYDANRIWVRNPIAGTITDGEQLTLSGSPVDSATLWYPGAPSLVIKDKTDHPVLIYEKDSAGGERLLSNYQPDETHPVYRVGFIPGIPVGSCCDGNTSVMSLNAVVSLNHIPVSKPNDFFLIQNFMALKQGIYAMKHRYDGNVAAMNACLFGAQVQPTNARNATRSQMLGGAITMLQAEVRKMNGDRTEVAVTYDHSRSFKHNLAWMR